MAPTTFRLGDETSDLVAISAGTNFPTAIYRLSHDGNLVDVEDPWDEYLTDDEVQAESSGSGSSLVGLPTWMDAAPFTGCFAAGEVVDENVKIICEQEKEKFTIGSSSTGEGDTTDFGRHLAAIPPLSGDAWLLAVAARSFFTVYSSSLAPGEHRSVAAHPTFDGDHVPAPIVEMTAGRLADATFFVAVTTSDTDNDVPGRVHLFTQDGPGSHGMTQVACLDRGEDPGFGTVLASGDLDSDGNDELLVSASSAPDRTDAVYVWEIGDLADAAPTCTGDAPEPAAVVVPGEGPLDIRCDGSGGCEFGFAIAVGDIATDDDGPELIVGAPGAKVGGAAQAGAVFVYRGAQVMASGDEPIAPEGRVAHSSPKSKHRFGASLAVAPMAGRNELLVGATGKGQVLITYCTGVGEGIENGADVTTSTGGSVVSTRCRPK
jgi:hypothetical protein